MKLKLKILLLLAVLFGQAGCLGIFSSGKQAVRITAQVPDVHLTIIREGRVIVEARLPADVELERKPGLVAVFSAPGYHTISRTIQPSYSNGRCLTSSCLSVFTLGFGLLFDALNEEFYAYPDFMEVEMIPLSEEFAEFRIRLRPAIMHQSVSVDFAPNN